MSAGKLPEGWVKTNLQSIAVWGSGGTPSRRNDEFYNGNIPWIKTGDLGSKLISRASEYITEAGIQNSSAKFFPRGSVAIAMYGATIGKTSILDIDATTNQACAVGTPLPGATSSIFLYYYLLNEKSSFIKKGKGGAQPNISQAVIKEHSVNLPPYTEQKIIAEKLDTLLAQVDSTKARLEQIPKILKRFRQAVLTEAVSGKKNHSESSIKKLSDISKFQNGYAFKSSWFAKEGPYQVIKLANIRDGYLFLENAPSYVNDEIGREFSKFSPEKGDILIGMTGTRFKRDYGFSCLNTQKQKLLINQRVGRIIPLEDKISSEYLSLFVRSALFREQFFKGETGGVNQGNVGSQHIASITLSLPPMQEQHEIVRRVEQLFAYADTIEKQVNAALTRVNHLTQSILAKAFRGELTAQWREENPDLISGENSAASLLEKIKAERAASVGKKAPRKKA
ncbi:restriction endonuclease subunit S [Pectobacterium sp. CHL-2024]|uniref:restriction endonuclease subunit S n=1 Tax=Pectobacterium TaxID=122277 RepID=UPI0015DF7508|nr:restriction endonuclease subunit S [Pectobacterium brasiliense]MBA0207673.1 restriction endonuclease subunit S [Pectobacterium brasiliense]